MSDRKSELKIVWTFFTFFVLVVSVASYFLHEASSKEDQLVQNCLLSRQFGSGEKVRLKGFDTTLIVLDSDCNRREAYYRLRNPLGETIELKEAELEKIK
jgi:hypothetical protein